MQLSQALVQNTLTSVRDSGDIHGNDLYSQCSSLNFGCSFDVRRLKLKFLPGCQEVVCRASVLVRVQQWILSLHASGHPYLFLPNKYVAFQ